ncbi:TPA: hypothetical protein ACH9M4_005259, partial [Escherichia coli]
EILVNIDFLSLLFFLSFFVMLGMKINRSHGFVRRTREYYSFVHSSVALPKRIVKKTFRLN